MYIQQRQSVQPARRGTLIPAIAVGLLVAAGGIALVLDQLWLSTAKSELQTSANAAALAAAQKIVNEELLKNEFDAEEWATTVRKTAGKVALNNHAVGQWVAIDIEPQHDVRLGRPVMDQQTGQVTFIETDYRPSSVIVMTHCDRESGNPVSLFMPYLTGQTDGDVVASAEATVSNQISAVRPLDHANVPAWPIAILENNGNEFDDWTTAIESQQGADQFGWDNIRKVVTEGADGLPEMILKTTQDDQGGNVRIVNLGTELFDDALETQFKNGFNWQHLQEFGSELGFEEGSLPLEAVADFAGVPFEQLQQQIGQTRIVLLYQKAGGILANGSETVSATRLVAIRLLSVQKKNQEIEMRVQPTIIATRTARISENLDFNSTNKYIYRLALTQ